MLLAFLKSLRVNNEAKNQTVTLPKWADQADAADTKMNKST